jgi:hypothetical protein
VEATPPPPFKMPEPDLLFEILIIALDTPAQLGANRDSMSFRPRRPILTPDYPLGIDSDN